MKVSRKDRESKKKRVKGTTAQHVTNKVGNNTWIINWRLNRFNITIDNL